MKTQPIHLICAEDDPQDAAAMLHEISTLPLANTVLHLTDGQAVLDFFLGPLGKGGRAAAFDPCLLLLDLGLPKVDGFTVLYCLKSHPLTSEIPVVILTSSNEDYLLARSLEIAADAFVVKPLTREKLQRVVARLGIFWELTAPATGRGRRRQVSAARKPAAEPFVPTPRSNAPDSADVLRDR